jgi:hypothetical protein
METLKATFTNKSILIILWFGLSLFAVTKGILFAPGISSYQNYIIYKYNFLDLIHQYTLFGPHPGAHLDLNHYGPVFGLVIAPFALMPDKLGVVLWVFFNAWMLYTAIMCLPIKPEQKLIILLLNVNSMMSSSANVQVNAFIAALIIFSFVFIKRQQDFWAALAIILGTAIKLYGIVGLAFFFFSEHKVKLLLSMLFWSAVLFVLPMFLSSPSFIITTYHDWYFDLLTKNATNENATRTDICVMGMISRVFNDKHLSNLIVLVPALFLFALSYIKKQFWKNTRYQLLLLASTLIFTVIYSTGSEPPTYIIGFAGVGIWFVALEKPISGFEWFLLIFALAVTSFSSSDIMPRYIRDHFILPYKLIALPCLLIWIKIIYEMLIRDFRAEKYVASPVNSQKHSHALQG